MTNTDPQLRTAITMIALGNILSPRRLITRRRGFERAASAQQHGHNFPTAASHAETTKVTFPRKLAA